MAVLLTGRELRTGVPTLGGATIPGERTFLVAAVAGIGVGSLEALPWPRWSCPYEGRRLSSSPDAGGAGRTVDLGVPGSMINVFLQGRRRWHE